VRRDSALDPHSRTLIIFRRDNARWLHERGLTLQDARQPHIDDWIVSHPSRAVPTRAFLDWAHHAGITP
jgi:hypothetical protein